LALTLLLAKSRRVPQLDLACPPVIAIAFASRSQRLAVGRKRERDHRRGMLEDRQLLWGSRTANSSNRDPSDAASDHSDTKEPISWKVERMISGTCSTSHAIIS
jgi:hypothetical protein